VWALTAHGELVYTVFTDTEEPTMNNSYFPPEMTPAEIQAFREEMEFWLDQEADPLYNVNMELTTLGGCDA
jgi:hypothetical protein